ncbi:glycosyltransferase involved in cell wall biosynthesis [Dysgonomonas alginatilytica]|uniref:Glycosyltransferase involved in cell wall biosynthesis n=1 Tax=Dysgonomonas alginatilytica TaxID=1605892 RepID=A0A2V3PRD9_9BACT|nr:glycosyltransferase [Dysgonomonas alginatilytica]PXV64123.1 glycosyltransferase involved in cell wall biosynthesis [Dysgonomonas alginatilytica]
MKVTHISVATTGGAGIAAYRLHCALLKYTDVDSNFVQQYNLAKENLGAKVYTVPPVSSFVHKIKCHFEITPEHLNWKNTQRYPGDYEIITYPRTSYRIENLDIFKDTDIVHLHWVADFINYPSFFKKIKKPILWTLHDMNPFMGLFHYEGDRIRNEATLGKLDHKIFEQKIRYIDRNKDINIVCPSDWLKNKSQASLILGRYPHYTSIPHGIDLSKYPDLDRLMVKEKLGLNNGLKTILFVAHDITVYRKGIGLLIDAINQLDTSKFNLVSVGGGKIQLNSKINYIHFPKIHDISVLNTIYSAADLTVIPSREDVITNVMPESFANGTPVLSFSNGGMVEHIKTGENGILVEEISVKSLIDNLKDFLDNNYSFNNEDIRKYALDHFSEKLHAEKYKQLYEDILNKRK